MTQHSIPPRATGRGGQPGLGEAEHHLPRGPGRKSTTSTRARGLPRCRVRRGRRAPKALKGSKGPTGHPW
jgi:hypothetical protein